MPFNKKVIEKLKEAGIEIGKPIVVKANPEIKRAVMRFVKKVEGTHKRVGDY